MAAYGGILGSVKISGTPDLCVGDVKSWSADIQWANEDTTTFDCTGTRGAWGQNQLTMKSISGSIEVNLNVGDANQLSLINALFGGTSNPTLELYPYNSTVYLTVPALITGVSFNSTATGIVTATLSFVQSGSAAPTFTTA